MEQSGHNTKRIIKNTIYLYIRMFIILIVSLYTVRIVLQTLGVEDYGVYNAVGGVVFALSFMTGVLRNASQRFFSYELGRNNIDSLKEVFTTISICYIGMSILVVLLSETIGLWFVYNKMVIPDGRLGAALWVYQCAIFSFVIAMLTNPYQAILVSHENMSVYAYISIIEVFAKLIIVFFIIFLPYDKLILYSLLMLLTTISVNSIYFIYCRRKYEESRFVFSWNNQRFRSIFSYSSWTLFGTLAGQCNTQGVNILLNLFFGPLANTAYSIGSQVSSQVQGFGSNFYTAVKPPLIKSYAQKDLEYTSKLFFFSSKALFVLLYIIILPIFIETYEILHLWLGKVEIYMVPFVRLFLIYTLLLSLSNPITTLVQAAGRVKLYHTFVDGFSLISLPIIYVLFRFGFSAKTGFYVTITVFALAHLIRLFVAQNVIENFSFISYINRIVWPIILTIILSLFPVLFIKKCFLGNGYIFIISILFLSVFLSSFVSFFIVFNKIERNQLIRFIRVKIHL